MVKDVKLSSAARKQLRKVPLPIARNLLAWVRAVELSGLEQVRKIPGYHDEALRGQRKGQRSIRLNRAYRAIYEVTAGAVELVLVLEVNKHDC